MKLFIQMHQRSWHVLGQHRDLFVQVRHIAGSGRMSNKGHDSAGQVLWRMQERGRCLVTPFDLSYSFELVYHRMGGLLGRLVACHDHDCNNFNIDQLRINSHENQFSISMKVVSTVTLKP